MVALAAGKRLGHEVHTTHTGRGSIGASSRHEDMKLLRDYPSDDDLRESLDYAQPGIIDPRSGLTGIPNWDGIRLHPCPGVISSERNGAGTMRRKQKAKTEKPHATDDSGT
jgi:hypothetical protein